MSDLLYNLMCFLDLKLTHQGEISSSLHPKVVSSKNNRMPLCCFKCPLSVFGPKHPPPSAACVSKHKLKQTLAPPPWADAMWAAGGEAGTLKTRFQLRFSLGLVRFEFRLHRGDLGQSRSDFVLQALKLSEDPPLAPSLTQMLHIQTPSKHSELCFKIHADTRVKGIHLHGFYILCAVGAANVGKFPSKVRFLLVIFAPYMKFSLGRMFYLNFFMSPSYRAKHGRSLKHRSSKNIMKKFF